MTIHDELARAAPQSKTAITIGTFDGVHLGHRHLLRRLIEASRREGLTSLALTFRNHPRSVLDPSVPLEYITDLDTRVALIGGIGVDRVVCIDFTKELSTLRASQFVQMLVEALQMRGLVVGPDFALGHRREGDIPTLRRLASEMGFWVEAVDSFAMEDRIIKSSSVRKMIGRGQVDAAHRMLDRPFSLTGLVVEGAKRGRQLGFPTANLSLEAHLVLPCDGIYATWAVVEGRRYLSATSVGVRPTFGSGQRVVESYLMDFDGDLYGCRLTLEFAGRLREELAFATAEELVEQMKRDVEQSRTVLAEHGRAG